MNPFIDLLTAHRSVRKFKDKPVEAAVLQTLITAAQCAATSNHIQACTIIRVNAKAHRKQIADLAGPQPWVEEAPVFLIFCADLTRLKSACDHHGLTPETGWAEQFIVATVDTALLAQNLMVASESIGLGGVFIGGIRNDPDQVCDLLNIPNHAYPVFGMCIGYPDQPPAVKPRLPVKLVLKEDTFQGKGSTQEAANALDDYDKTIRDYYLGRDSNRKDQTWRLLMADFMSRINRPHMKPFLEKKRFFLK